MGEVIEKEKASKAYKAGKDKASDYYEDAKDSIKGAAGNAKDSVEDYYHKPWRESRPKRRS